MSLSDLLILVILGVCILISLKSMRKSCCHDCRHCQQNCGGNYGKKYGKIIKNQRKSDDSCF